ncbi:MAG: tetratricopeptide repeat protein [Shewanella sp.]
MPTFINIIFILLISISFNTFSRDLITQEIELREATQQFYDTLNASIAFPLDFDNREQFEQLAEAQGYSPTELQQQLQLLARLNLEPGVKSTAGFQQAESLIALLSRIATTPNQLATVDMLRGRYIGRIEQKYQETITVLNNALTRIKDKHDLEAMLLKHNIHDQLGTIYLILRQNEPALTHYHIYRDTAYQLKNDYLMATAEARLGAYYNRIQQHKMSLQHYSEAFKHSNSINYPTMATHLQLQLARVYRDLKQWDDALKHAHEAAAGFKQLGNNTYLSNAMTVIAMVYGEKGDWNQAIDFYLNAQQLDAKQGNYIAQGLNFHNLGQAYFNINDKANALKYLLLATDIFEEKQSNHYLVYNELLIADVAEAKQDWPLLITHAESALALATQLNIIDEQKSALTQIALAAERLGDKNKTIATQKRIIELSQQEAADNSSAAATKSALAEQQLKMELNMLQSKLDNALTTMHNTTNRLVICGAVAMLLIICVIMLLRQRQQLTRHNTALQALNQQEAFTHHLGYAALLSQLNQRSGTESTTKILALALIEFPECVDADRYQGQYFANTVTNQLIQLLSARFNMPIFVIRQGIFAIGLTETITPADLVTAIREQLDQQFTGKSRFSPFHLGLINVPLLAKPEIRIHPQLVFETAQMALAGARGLPTETDNYVTLKVLDFVSPSLFANPLFLHIEKAIERGLIRVETNGDKNAIQWPCWEHNHHKELVEHI